MVVGFCSSGFSGLDRRNVGVDRSRRRLWYVRIRSDFGRRVTCSGVSSSSSDAPPPESGSDYVAKFQVDDGVLSEGPLMPPRLARAKKEQAKFSEHPIVSVIILGILFTTWYVSNTIFNIYNKQVLRAYPFPLTCTIAQFGIGAIMMSTMWLTRIQRVPILDRDSIKTLVILSCLHAAGFFLTNASLGAVSVAFTHTVPTWGVIAALMPIVIGVGLASATEATFTWYGFISAMGSNLALQSRNVYSKRYMKKGESSIDNVNLFALITIGAFILLAPVGAAVEASTSIPALTQTALPTKILLWKIAMGGVMRCLDVLASYMILKRVSPVSHSVGNCVKRAVVITSSVILFKTPVTPLNAFGTTMALIGVLVYSLVVVGCKQNKFGPDSPLCRPVYEELDLVEGAGI